MQTVNFDVELDCGNRLHISNVNRDRFAKYPFRSDRVWGLV